MYTCRVATAASVWCHWTHLSENLKPDRTQARAASDKRVSLVLLAQALAEPDNGVFGPSGYDLVQTSSSMAWHGMVEVCEGAPVAVSGWVLADRHDRRPCAASSLHRGTMSVSDGRWVTMNLPTLYSECPMLYEEAATTKRTKLKKKTRVVK